jgi:hypothetical protein
MHNKINTSMHISYTLFNIRLYGNDVVINDFNMIDIWIQSIFNRIQV